MVKSAEGDSLLVAAAGHGDIDFFRGMARCLTEHLTREKVRHSTPFKTPGIGFTIMLRTILHPLIFPPCMDEMPTYALFNVVRIS